MFAATQQIASVAGLKATKVQVRISFRIARFEGWFRKKKMRDFLLPPAKAIKKKRAVVMKNRFFSSSSSSSSREEKKPERIKV